MNCPKFCAIPHQADATVNTRSATKKICRGPNRSANHPATGMKIAVVSI